ILGNTVKGQDTARAAGLYEGSLALRTEMGDTWGIAVAVNALADLAEAAGDTARASRLYRESLALRKNLGDRHGIAMCLAGMAAICAAQSRFEAGARLLAAAEALRETTGAALSAADATRDENTRRLLREGLKEERFAAAWEEGRGMPSDAASAYALELTANAG